MFAQINAKASLRGTKQPERSGAQRS